MGTGTCAVLWKTMRNVVSTQAPNGKGRRGDNCHLKAGTRTSERSQAYTHGLAGRVSTKLSQHHQQHQNVLSKVEGREEIGSILRRPKSVMGKS